ncbi:MAG: phage portal protein [Syntrophobacteraceae bacterium]
MIQKAKDWARKKVDRRHAEPERETMLYPRLMNVGGYTTRERPLVKPTAMNVRKFSRTVYARRAINAIKDPISMLEWDIVPKPGVKKTPEIERQCALVHDCFNKPNRDDSFQTLVEQVIEDIQVCGAGAIEQQQGSDPQRPVWLWPVDGMSIQIYAGWAGGRDEARYLQTLGYGNIGGVQGIDLRNDELIYIRKDPTTENPFGFGPLEIAFATINRQLTTAEYAGNVAGNAQPENVLLAVGASAEQIRTMRQWWQDEIEGQGVTPLVGFQDLKAIKLHSGNDGALYLLYQAFIIREIATAFALSPQNFGLEADVNRNTSETADDRDWKMAISPCAHLVRRYLNRECIEEKFGFFQIMHRWNGLEREDETETARRYAIEYRANGIIPDEYRAQTGRPPLKSKFGKLTCSEAQMLAGKKKDDGAREDAEDAKNEDSTN